MSGALDRAWPRRGLVSPPRFGMSLPPMWLDDEVTFSRPALTSGLVPDGLGGFSAEGPDAAYLTTMAHVRLVEPQGSTIVMSGDESLTRTRRLDVRIPYPDDVALVPKRGDLVTYLLHTGETLRLYVKDVMDPRGFSDHIHVIATEQG